MLALTGILLCGGKSLRMGTDKALLELKNQPMVTYPLQILKQWCSEIFISANNLKLDFLGYPIIHDEIINIGPMGGIYSCLKKSKNSFNIVLACDMPLISGVLLRTMMYVPPKYDAVVPVVNQRAEPLYAIYHKRILSKIELAMDQKTYSLQKLLSQLNVFYIDMGVQQTNELFNANTPAEITNYERLAGKSVS